MQKLIQTAMQSLIASFTSFQTSPLILQFAQTYSGPDESERISLIYAENEHFISSFNQHVSEDSDSSSAEDILHQISQALPKHLCNAINTDTELNFNLFPLQLLNLNNGLIHIAINNYQDNLFIQITDNLYYITFTYSGQY